MQSVVVDGGGVGGDVRTHYCRGRPCLKKSVLFCALVVSVF